MLQNQNETKTRNYKKKQIFQENSIDINDNDRVLAQINSSENTQQNFGSKSFVDTEEKHQESKDQLQLEAPFRKHIVFESKKIQKIEGFTKQTNFFNQEGIKQSEHEEASNFNQSEFSPILRQQANIFQQNPFDSNKSEEKEEQDQNENEMLQQLDLKQAVEIILPIEQLNKNIIRQQIAKNILLKQKMQFQHSKVQSDEQMGVLQGIKMNIQEINSLNLKQNLQQKKPKSQSLAHRTNNYFKNKKISNKNISPRFKEPLTKSQINDDILIRQMYNDNQDNIYHQDHEQSINMGFSGKQAQDLLSGPEERSKFSRQSENAITEKIQTPDGADQHDNFQNFQNSRLQYNRVQFQKQILIKNTEKLDSKCKNDFLQSKNMNTDEKLTRLNMEANDPRIVSNPSDEKFLIVKLSEFQINLPQQSKENMSQEISKTDLHNTNLNSERIYNQTKKTKIVLNEGVKSSSSTNRNRLNQKLNQQNSKDKSQVEHKSPILHENIVTNQIDDEGNLVLNLLPKNHSNEKSQKQEKQQQNHQKYQNIQQSNNNQLHQIMSNDKIKDLFDSQLSFGVSTEKNPQNYFIHQNISWKLTKQFQNRIKKAQDYQNKKIQPELFQLLYQEKQNIQKQKRLSIQNQLYESNQYSLQQQQQSLQYDSEELNFENNMNKQYININKNNNNPITYQDQSKISKEQISITNNDQIKTEFLITTRKNTLSNPIESKQQKEYNKDLMLLKRQQENFNKTYNDKSNLNQNFDVLQNNVKIDSISSLYTQKLNQMQIQEQDENSFPSNNLVSGLLDPEVTLEGQQAIHTNINTQVKKVESIVERNSIQLSDYKKNDQKSDLQKSRSQQYSEGAEIEDGIQSMLSLQKMKITATTDKNNSIQQNSQTIIISKNQNQNKIKIKRFKKVSISPNEKKQKRINIAKQITISPNEEIQNLILMNDQATQRVPFVNSMNENRILNFKKNSTIDAINYEKNKYLRKTNLSIALQKKPIKNWYFVSSLLQKQKTNEKYQSIQKSDYNSDTDGQASTNNNMLQEIPQFLQIKQSIKLQKPSQQIENKMQDQALTLQSDQISLQNRLQQIYNSPLSAKNFVSTSHFLFYNKFKEQQKNDCEQIFRSFMMNSIEQNKDQNMQGTQERAARTAQISHRKRNTLKQPFQINANILGDSTDDNQSHQVRDSTQLQMPPNYLPSSNFSKSILQNQENKYNSNQYNENFYLLHINNIQLQNPQKTEKSIDLKQLNQSSINRQVDTNFTYQKYSFPSHKLQFQNHLAQQYQKKISRNQKNIYFTGKQQAISQLKEQYDQENIEKITQIQNQKEEVLKNLFLMKQVLLRKQNSSETYQPKYQNVPKKQQNLSYAENAEKNSLKYKTRYKNSDLDKEWINGKNNLVKLFMRNDKVKIQDRDIRLIQPRASKGLQVSFQSLQDNNILQEQLSKRQLSSNNEQRLSQMKNRKQDVQNASGTAEVIFSKQNTTFVPSINTSKIVYNEFTFQEQFPVEQFVNNNALQSIQPVTGEKQIFNKSNQINQTSIENQILDATKSSQRDKINQQQMAKMFEQEFFRKQNYLNVHSVQKQKEDQKQEITNSTLPHKLNIIQEKEGIDTEIISSQYLTNREQNKKQFDNFSLIQQTIKTSTDQSYYISKRDQQQINEQEQNQIVFNEQNQQNKEFKIKQNGYNDYFNYMKKNKNKQNKLIKLKESIIQTQHQLNEKYIINQKKQILKNQINFVLDRIVPEDTNILKNKKNNYQKDNQIIVFAQSGLGQKNCKLIGNIDRKQQLKNCAYSPQIIKQQMERIDTENTILFKKERFKS